MSLQVWLPLNGDLHNQGCSNVTVTNNGATINTSGKIGSCYAFNGSNQYLYTNYKFYNTQYSVCAWIYSTSASATQTIVCDRTTVGYGFSIFLIGGKIRIDPGGNNIQWTTNYTYPTNTWFHLSITYDGTKVSYYINGEFKQEYTCALASSYWGNTTSIGASQANGSGYDNYLNGRLNDVRIYDHALSAAEVKEISQGLVLHYKLDDAVGFTDLIARNVNVTAYNNHGNTNNPTTITYLSQQYNGDRIIQYSATPNSSVISSIQGGMYSHGIYNWNRTFKANTKYVFWIYYKPITHLDTVAGGTASNIGGWTEIPPVAVGDGWYRVGQYRDGTVTTDKTDNIFVSYKTPSAVAGDNIIIYFASPHLIEGITEIPSYDYPSTIIQDSSGYNYNGTILGNPTISSDTTRYISSTSFPANTDGILSTYPLTLQNNAFTYSFWIKPSGENGGRSVYAASYSGTSCSIEKTTGNKLRFYWSGSPDLTTSSLTITDGTWQHIAVVKSEDKTKVYCYYNGELKDTFTNTFNNKTFSGNLRIARDTRGDATSYTGLMSDFRIYCTALTADDILQLYHTSAKIDNKQNLHSFEFNETSLQKITKSGQVIGQNLLETYIPLYDKNIYTEPDGSTWIHIFHHNNPANSKFNEPTLDWTTGKYLDVDRWYDVDQAVYYMLSPYEFMVKQKTTSSAAETKYRWVQTANPLTAVWADVKPGTVTFNTSSGYTSSSHGGMYLLKSSNLHMCIANSSNGNWYGGIGAAAAYQGGIPGYPNTTVTSGYIDLYVRVYNGTKIIKNIGISSSEFIEL